MSRPQPAPLPDHTGIYWLKVSSRCRNMKAWTWNTLGIEWIVGEVDRIQDSETTTYNMIGTDEFSYWSDKGSVVIEVGPEIFPPDKEIDR